MQTAATVQQAAIMASAARRWPLLVRPTDTRGDKMAPSLDMELFSPRANERILVGYISGVAMNSTVKPPMLAAREENSAARLCVPENISQQVLHSKHSFREHREVQMLHVILKTIEVGDPEANVQVPQTDV